MLGLSANLNYFLFNGNVDLWKGIFRLYESIREEMLLDPSDASNVYMFMSWNRMVVKILHYESGFYVFNEKRPVMGKSKKPVFDEVSKCYRINCLDGKYNYYKMNDVNFYSLHSGVCIKPNTGIPIRL